MRDCACSFCSAPCGLTGCGLVNASLACIKCISDSLFVTICGSAESNCKFNADCNAYASCAYGCL
jgi:hypothetical protein